MTTAAFPDEAVDRDRLGPLVAPALDRALAALRRGRFPHSLLIVGPEALGRELLAREIAVMLACRDDTEPFSDTPEAHRIREGTHPDVVLVAGEGAKGLIKIDAIREIVEQAPGRPFEGRRRVWILDAVDRRLERQAANAFLKVLEEPPDHVCFLLLAANPQALLPTIRSRCSRLMLPGLVGAAEAGGALPPEVAHRLRDDPEVADLVARAGEELGAVLAGETMPALRLATRFGQRDGGLELLAAAAVEASAAGDQRCDPEACAGIAAELLGCSKAVRVLGLRPERQILACLLRWGSQRGGL